MSISLVSALARPTILYRMVTPPATEPVGIGALRSHLGLDPDDASMDSELEAFEKAARRAIEQYCGLSIIDTVWEATTSVLAEVTPLRKRPFSSLASIKYVRASDGEILTIPATTYHVLPYEQLEGAVYLGEGQSWPDDAAVRANAVRITFTAGFGTDEADVPDDIRQAILMTVANFDANRGDCSDSAPQERMGAIGAGSYARPAPQVLTPAVRALLDPYVAFRLSVA